MTTLTTPIKPHRSLLESSFRLIDAVAILTSLVVSVQWTAPWDMERAWVISAAAIILHLLIGEFTGMYRNWRGAQVNREALCAAITWGLVVAGLLAAGFATRYINEFPRRTIGLWLLLAPLTIIASRLLVRSVQRALRARGWNTRRYAIVGINDLGLQLAANIEAAPQLGLELEGFYDDRPPERTPDIPESLGQYGGNIDQLVEAARAGRVDMIYISFPMRAEERIRHDLLKRLADSTASVYIVPDFFVFELLHSRWTDIGGLPVVSVFDHPFYGVDGLVKRVMDLTLSLMLLIGLAIPMTIVAALVKLTSRGPVFFRQKRYGLDGREVRVWKFRSMRVCEDGPTVAQATRNDSRVTPVGKFLRKSSLDELPQLFNVVAGSMSLVGPRPHATAHNEEYRQLIPGYMLRHKVKPGITGYAQVNGWRGETETLEKMEKRVEFDHRYIRQWSLWLDIKILFKTIFVVFKDEKAY